MSSSARKVVIGTVVVLLVVGAGIGFVRVREYIQWNAAKVLVATFEAEARDRKEPRTVLRGNPEPGSAWDDYTPAIDEAGSLVKYRELLVAFVARRDDANRTEVEKLLAAHTAVLDGLHRGAGRADGQYPYDWAGGASAKIPNILGCRVLPLMAAAQARIWTERGKARDAVSLLLDLALFSHDLGMNAPLVSHMAGVSAYSTALGEMRYTVLSLKLPSEDYHKLAEALDTLDRDFPRIGPSFANERLAFIGATDEELGEAVKPGSFSSVRSMAIEASQKNVARMKPLQTLDDVSYPEALKIAAADAAERAKFTNPLLTLGNIDVAKLDGAHREALARLRILQMAVWEMSFRDFPDLPDPFGDKLFTSRPEGPAGPPPPLGPTAPVLKIWSVGSDGKSQDGRGSWGPSQDEDLVLEIISLPPRVIE